MPEPRKVAISTGASRGIGAGLAAEFRRVGWLGGCGKDSRVAVPEPERWRAPANVVLRDATIASPGIPISATRAGIRLRAALGGARWRPARVPGEERCVASDCRLRPLACALGGRTTRSGSVGPMTASGLIVRGLAKLGEVF
jgi:hypothetical protein